MIEETKVDGVAKATLLDAVKLIVGAVMETGLAEVDGV